MPPDGPVVIFDCDGVLVDSEPLANAVMADALADIGLPLSSDEVTERFVGLSMQSCLRLIEEELGQPAPAWFLPRLQAKTWAAFDAGLDAVRGVEAAIDHLDIPFCVASSGSLEKMRKTLGLTGLLQRFEGRMFSAEQVERGKPAPDLFLHAAAAMGASASRCTVVEDSVPGAQAGVAAGMRVLGYAERADAARLERAGAEVFFDMARLPALIGAVP